ncbi:MAG: OsmC family protein [Gemmatimonadota bacterium]|nr:OsmC family protein [Gemmatimonadota bacterium]
MKITLLSDDAIRLTPEPGPMTIEAQSAEQAYSPFHMLASGLATCTFSVMYSWATHADLRADDLAIEVRWTFADDPQRVGEMSVTFDWPSLPERRLAAAKRVAEMCTIHATLKHPPRVTIEAARPAVAEAAATPTAAQ